MVDTIKFSEMTDGGNIANNDKTPGLQSGANVLFNNPWTFLPSGTTADRPSPAADMYFRLRFNTDLQEYEFYDSVLGVWTQLQDSDFSVGPFITYTDDPSLPDAQNLGALADGLLKQTITLGVATLDIAVNGTDYWAPGDELTRTQAPVIGDDVTNKTYVDALVGGAVTSLEGTANQVLVNATSGTPETGAIVLTTPQDIAPSSSPTFAGLTMTGDIDMDGFKAINAADPTNPQDYATKFYVDQTALSGTSVYASTTATLNATQSGAGVGATLTDASGTFAPFSTDGVAVPLNENVLNKDQAVAANQGIYTLTQNGDGISIPWVLTRSVTYDTPEQINQTGLITVRHGSTLAGTQWFNTTTIVTVDTTNFNYSQFGSSYVESVTGTVNQIDVDNSDAQNPILSLSATVDLPGTFDIQSSTAVDEILDEDDMVSDSPTGLATQQSIKAYVDNSVGENYVAQGRLTLTSNTPVTVNDVTAAGTIYYTPYQGNYLNVYNGTRWERLIFTEISIAVPAVATQLYDVFVYNNAGVATLELTAWTNDTTRATALTTQDGVYVKSGALTRRYLGSFRTIAASQTEDSVANRFLWNYYNRANRKLKATDLANSWNYTSATWQQANANVANQINLITGVAEQFIPIEVFGALSNTSASIEASVGIGVSSTTVNSADNWGFTAAGASGGGLTQAKLQHVPDVGLVFYVWLESSAATGTTTWYGDNNGQFVQTGISAMMWG